MFEKRQLTEIAERFALGTDPRLIGDAVRGELGQVWRLMTSTGSWALKVLTEHPGEVQVQAAAGFQDAAVAQGVSAPTVVRTVDGRVLHEWDGVAVRVYSWAEIEQPDVHLDPVQVGRVLASIHRLDYPCTGHARPWYTEPVGPPRWDRLITELHEAGSTLAADLAGVRGELCALESLLEDPASLRQLHLDLWADNVRGTPSGDLCILDWDNAGPGDPNQELAAVLFEYCSADSARARALNAAYLDAGGPGRITRRGNFSMATAQLGHILAWQCGNWLNATTCDQRDHAHEAIEEYLSRPLTRPVIEQIIEAVTS